VTLGELQIDRSYFEERDAFATVYHAPFKTICDTEARPRSYNANFVNSCSQN
jgi:hypothetical protein